MSEPNGVIDPIETIEDIVASIRAQNQGLPEDANALSPLVCALLRLADRIDTAHKREVAAVKVESIGTLIEACEQMGGGGISMEYMLQFRFDEKEDWSDSDRIFYTPKEAEDGLAAVLAESKDYKHLGFAPYWRVVYRPVFPWMEVDEDELNAESGEK